MAERDTKIAEKMQQNQKLTMRENLLEILVNSNPAEKKPRRTT
jgi:hypothetical protein